MKSFSETLKHIKNIIRWAGGLLLTLFVILYVILSLPIFQTWIGSRVANVLSSLLDTKVRVERVQLGFTGRAVVDNLEVLDRQDRPMLFSTRTGVKIDLQKLIGNGDIIIHSAQLFGAKIRISQERADTATNIQFVLDAFASKDTTSKPAPHVEIRSIMVRHTDITFDKKWKKKLNTFDPNHISITDASITASLNILKDDTLDVSLKKMSLREASGITISNGRLELRKDSKGTFHINEFLISLLGTSVQSDHIVFHLGGNGAKPYGEGNIKASITPSNLKAFYEPLQEVDDVIDIDISAYYRDSSVTVSKLNIDDSEKALRVAGTGTVRNIGTSSQVIDARIDEFEINSNIEHAIWPMLDRIITGGNPTDVVKTNNTRRKIQYILRNVGTLSAQASVRYANKKIEGDAAIRSGLGDLNASGSYTDDRITLLARAVKVKAGILAQDGSDTLSSFGDITADIEVNGRIKGPYGYPDGKASISIKEATIKGYTYRNIKAEASRNGNLTAFRLQSKDPSALLDAGIRASLSKVKPFIEGLVYIKNFDFPATNLPHPKNIDRLSLRAGIDLHDNTLDNMEGHISIPHIIIHSESQDTTLTLTNIQLKSSPDKRRRHIELNSPYVKAVADGEFELKGLLTHAQLFVHNWLPNVIKGPTYHNSTTDASFSINLTDISPLKPLLGLDASIDEGPLKFDAQINSSEKILKAVASAPNIKVANEELHDVSIVIDQKDKNMDGRVSLKRIMSNKPVGMNLNIRTTTDSITTMVAWDNFKGNNKGEIALRGTLEHNATGGLAAYADILPTDLYINDTLWHVNRSQLYYRNKELYVDNFKIEMQKNMSQSEHSLSIHGTASANLSDTLFVNLQNIDLDYIFTIVKVKPIALSGHASGLIAGAHVFSTPQAYALITVPDFKFNKAEMGVLRCPLTWGEEPGSLGFNGTTITDRANNAKLNVDGYLHLVKDPIQHINLDINFTRANAMFMQRYIGGIMDDFEGRVSGKAKVVGNFGAIDILADAKVDTIGLTIPSLNARFFAYGDSIHLRPDGVYLNNITAYDRDGHPGMREHSATVNGRIKYEHFQNMHYLFNIEGRNILAYHQEDFNDMPFYATVWGTGGVKLEGGPGYTNIDINATPEKGTVLTYNASGPDAITQAGFITFVDRSTQVKKKGDEKPDEDDRPTSDMRINFNIHLNPDSQLKLLMDQRTGDYITLYGNSNLLATYYNKGSFKMYGTYTVDRGTYNLTLQDIIHKDFQFRRNGTIVFGGNPMNADLDLQAVYTVPSVSLNDLSAKGTFSNTNVRVNCIMNLGGKAGEPRITFDFDIPNVNEEEARMVRTLISTEEERNLQVIYLLGIGRFYTYDYTGDQNQSSMAMNSLISSTLSGQLNQIINNITGTTDWNFGANLVTGNTGWSDMDVEGRLSGRMLNNRLLFNGNFGYRDTPVANNNFVGDFDLQYLLTKNGNVILKAYSETNDRYFTKSALTTQGVGLLVKRDFSNWRELTTFIKNRQSKKKR